MDTQEITTPPEVPEVIVLGTASVETKGIAGFGESTGIGLPMIPGISED